MRLRDDAFMYPEAARPRQSLGQAKAALSGVGDRDLRAAQDFLWSMGLDMPGMDRAAADQTVNGWRPAVGDEVEFALPSGDGLRRAGRIHELTRTDAIVQVAAGEYNIVPLPFLQPLSAEPRRAEKKADIRRALRGGGRVGSLAETRAPMPLGTSGDYSVTLQYQAGLKPSEEDVREFVAARYPEARIVDGDDSYPGRLQLVLAFPKDAQTVGPDQPPSSRMNATGIGSEEMEGTGKIGDAALEVEAGGAGAGPGDVEAAPPRMPPMSELSRRDYDRMRQRHDPQYQDPEETRRRELQKKRNLERHRMLDQQHQQGPAGPGDVEAAPPRMPPMSELSRRDYDRMRQRHDPNYQDPEQQQRERQKKRNLERHRLLDEQHQQGPAGIGPGEHNSAGDDGGPDTGAGGTGMGLSMTGRILEHMAALNPEFDFIEGAIEEDGRTVRSHFEVQRAGRPVFIRSGRLTTVLGEDAVPAQGVVQVMEDGGRYVTGAWFYGPDGLVSTTHLGIRREAADAYQDMNGPIPSHENEPGANEDGSYVIKADSGVQSPVATEEDGEARETIGGPGLHVAVDQPTEDYWEGYYGDYGEKLTQKVPARTASARVAMIRTAWREEAGQDPSADELLWVLGVLSRTADDTIDLNTPAEMPGQPAAPGPGAAPAAQSAGPPAAATETPPAAPAPANTTALANALIKAMHLDDRAAQAVDKVVTKYLAKVPARQRGSINPRDPATLQKMLPLALQQVAPAELNRLTRQFAPDQASSKGKWYNPRDWGNERTRRQMEQGLALNQALNPVAPAAPAGGGAPAAAPGGGASAGGGGGAALPAGTKVTTDKGTFVLTQPAQAKPETAQTAGEDEEEGGEGEIELKAGTQVMAVKGGRVTHQRLKAPLRGTVARRDAGVTWIKTEDGQYLGLQREAARKPRSEPRRGPKPYAGNTMQEAYAGRLPPAKLHLGFRMDGLVRRGDYLVMAVVWDADMAKDMAPASVAQNLKSYVKQRSSEKEFTDIGWIGKPVIEMLDLRAGLAEIKFRSSESRIAPPEFVQKEDGSYHEPIC